MVKKNKRILLLLIPLVIFILIVYVKKHSINSEGDEIKNLDLNIKGIVTNTLELDYGHDYGIITLDLESSNIDFYDKRNELEKFFGVIKSGNAEIVVEGISEFQKGDLYILKGEEYKIFRNNRLVVDDYYGYLSTSVFNPYNEIRRKLKL